MLEHQWEESNTIQVKLTPEYGDVTWEHSLVRFTLQGELRRVLHNGGQGLEELRNVCSIDDAVVSGHIHLPRTRHESHCKDNLHHMALMLARPIECALCKA